ncbi:hypothetical protein RAE19_03560 [Rhodoferax sp. TBRC 17660]|uniref:Iron transporter n=1 Tax=Rhodoferax potami TaxID=3068338 RepID=A0ABU3KK76_9BURK|nr:hypothetical protein [Rhodoferax sp. TBRC 17660]MDT7517822.1 hypothetical protein [Rhodoferax sp. TBRC 17660]
MPQEPITKADLSKTAEYLGWTIGAALSFVFNYAVTKGAISPAFDLINWLGLIALFVVTAIHIFWKVKRLDFKPNYTFVWCVCLGWSLGCWLVSRFVS